MLLPPEDDDALLRTRVRVTAAGPAVVRDRRDRAAVDAWSRDGGEAHLGPWPRFARESGGTAAWGIWHRVRPASR